MGQQQQQQQRRLVSLQESVPPGAHPGSLMTLMEFLRFIAGDGGVEKQQQQEAVVLSAAPAVVRVAGVLLLLEYAAPEVLAAPGPGVPFHVPPDFFNMTERCLQFFLVDVLWGTSFASFGVSQARQAPAESVTSTLSTCRREGLVAFATTFTSLVSLASTMLSVTEAQPKSRGSAAAVGSGAAEAPEHLRRALQRLEGLVMLLSELIPHVIRCSGDVGAATELLSVLVPSSSVESPLFAGVARRSLDVLRRWSVPTADNPPEAGKGVMAEAIVMSQQQQQSDRTAVGGEGVGAGMPPLLEEEVGSKLQSVARASMSARNRAVLQRFLGNTSSDEARQMAKTTLQTIVLLYPPDLGRRQQQQQQQKQKGFLLGKERGAKENDDDGDDEEEGEEEEDCNGEETEALQGMLLELARVVAHTGDDAEFRSLLSGALLGVCAALGFPSSP
ncbi:hypothetical protein DQ04_07391030 [Trypanosoma grayi]|uniref:hypothetical protein n=1 Tax=Trypanosoma grayi TaxID=71804 RepID=UPI0004F436CD|nr:hypothetical protein DQ04_07391030 [Trypanosoma grayi]KEG08354.1 hypothetical protein DQ04_07391030 [Trypanosoma grayi]